MLNALYERHIFADMLVGTSFGAINAAFMASRPQTVPTINALAHVWLAVQRGDVFPVSLGALVGGLCGQRDHIVPDRALRQLVHRNIGFDDLADTSTPLHLVAFDVIEAREVLLSAGPAVDAICAAMAIPGVFPRVSIGERRLIDGGVVNRTPISHAVELGAERIYVLATSRGRRPVLQPPRSALDAAMHGLSLMTERRLQEDIARYSDDVDLIVLPAPNALHVQPSNFVHAGRLIRDAYSAARQRLALTDRDRGRATWSRPVPARVRRAAA
jgi:NTE family protein